MLVQTVNSKPVTEPKNKVHSALRVGEEEIMDGPVKDLEEPLPLRALLTKPVVVSVANYGMIALLDMIAGTLISFIWSTSVEFGRLSMSPASIGLWTAGYGLMNCVFQFVAFRAWSGASARGLSSSQASFVFPRSTSCSPWRTWHYAIPVAA